MFFTDSAAVTRAFMSRKTEKRKKKKEEKKEKIRELVLGGFPMACLFHIAFNVLQI